jgi:5-methylcytosine-specific restriction enzyme subunit McrC
MSQTLTLFEHEAKPFSWTERDLTLLDQMRASSGAEILRASVRARVRTIQAAQHVGVVRLRNRTIQILPKLYRANAMNDQKVQAREATRNLLYMLEYAGNLPVREHDVAPLLKFGDDWFEILTHLFASNLREAWQRGAYRTYHTIEDDSPVLKGKWRISEQLKEPWKKHVFKVAFDEFTADNPLNRIFRYTVERLWRLTRNGGNRQLLGEIRQWMDEVALPAHVTAADADPAKLTRLNDRFRPLLNLARLFIDGGTLQMTAGDLSTFAFVFDMNQLFEAFIAEIIRRHRREVFDDQLSDCELLVQSHGATLFLAKRQERNVFQTKPDLTLRRAETFPVLIDTKYKRLDANDAKLGVSQADFYQMHAYAHRYDCPRAILLYPQMAGSREPLRERFPLHSGTKTIEAATVDLRMDFRDPQSRRNLVTELKTILKEQRDDRQ